jgi:hypothetical protein
MNAGLRLRLAAPLLLLASFTLVLFSYVSEGPVAEINTQALLASGTQADSQCSPYIAQCPCNEIPDPEDHLFAVGDQGEAERYVDDEECAVRRRVVSDAGAGNERIEVTAVGGATKRRNEQRVSSIRRGAKPFPVRRGRRAPRDR